MKPLRIEYIYRILTALWAVNGKATAFTICTPAEVKAIANDAIALMTKHNIPKSNCAGAVITYEAAGPRSKAYKYPVISTRLTLRVGADGSTIYLVRIERCRRYPGQAASFRVALKAKAYAAFMKRQAAIFDDLGR